MQVSQPHIFNLFVHANKGKVEKLCSFANGFSPLLIRITRQVLFMMKCDVKKKKKNCWI
jgi:hypothetical protein